MSISETNLTRRGFIVLSMSALGAMFIKPDLSLCDENKTYVVSIETTGYGFHWIEEDKGAGRMPERDAPEIAKESLSVGSIVRFSRDPDARFDDPRLLVLDDVSGEVVCDIPWCACAEEESMVLDIMRKMDAGMDVWGELVSAKHTTMDAGYTWLNEHQLARVHEIEFDVYCR